MTASRMMAIEAACIAGHLGEWHIGMSARDALQRGLQMAASRFTPFPDAPASRSQDALFRAAVDQVLALAGHDVPKDEAERHRSVIDAFNMLDGGIDLAAALGRIVAVEHSSTVRGDRTPMIRQIWRDRREQPHIYSHTVRKGA